jgi:exodeoxyribonuclease-5
VLNQDQMNAADQLQAFLNSDQKEFCLTGQAGTGKTYMLFSILGESAAYCATTNKAASVLRSLTGKADTIHSLLSLTVKNDFSSGKTSLIRNPKATPIRGKVIVVDEASMVDRYLHEIIREMCSESKIIYVGDDAQLPPVASGNFSVFKLDLPTAGLTQVMRSLDTPQITQLSTALRAAVFNGQNVAISERAPDILRINAHAAHDIVTYMVQNDKWHSTILLSYTNARATAAVKVIRGAANKPASLIPGDTVVVNSAFKMGEDWIPTDSMVEIQSISPVDGSPHLIVAHTDYGDMITYKDNSKLQAAIAKAAAEKDWNEYFKLKQTFIDLRHAEALTIHKSQGSTFETVFVDMGSLATCRNPNERRRLLYVACSRAKSKLYLVA